MTRLVRLLHLLGSVLSISLLTACSSVTLVRPLPSSAEAAHRERLQGRWCSGGEIIEVMFAADGTGKIAGLSWEGDHFAVEDAEFTVNVGKTRRFLSGRAREHGHWEEEYFLVQYTVTDEGDLVLWTPEVGAFVEAIDQHRIAGEVTVDEHSTHVVITGPDEELLVLLNDPERGDLFDYQDPMVIRRAQCGK